MNPIHVRMTVEELDDDGEVIKTSTMTVKADEGFLDFLAKVGNQAFEEVSV